MDIQQARRGRGELSQEQVTARLHTGFIGVAEIEEIRALAERIDQRAHLMPARSRVAQIGHHEAFEIQLPHRVAVGEVAPDDHRTGKVAERLVVRQNDDFSIRAQLSQSREQGGGERTFRLIARRNHHYRFSDQFRIRIKRSRSENKRCSHQE